MGKKIADNESIKDLKQYRKSGKTLKKISKIFGIKLNVDIDDLIAQTFKLEMLPDLFNDIFAQKGWIAHDSMNMEIMEKSIELGAEEGEKILIKYYEGELERFLNKLAHQPIFKERDELFNLAKDDYFCGRYHSCVPIILMLADGIVNDFRSTGLYAENTDLNVWDSLVGHSTGLDELVSILTKGRKKTITDPIDLPYRNGILHGRDLGYNNKVVAIKSFAVLFYVYDWSVSLESEDSRKKKYLEERKKNEKITFFDLGKKILSSNKKLVESRKLLQEWKPREFGIGFMDMSIENDTPEQAAIMFLGYIKSRNYGSPVLFYANNLYKDISVNEKAGLFRREFGSIEILDFNVCGVVDESPAVTDVTININYLKNETQKSSNIKFRMVYEIGVEIENRLVRGGSWKIVNIEGISYQL